MQRSTLEEFARFPVGSYVAGESFAHFCAAPTLWGVILWGRPDEGQAQALGRSLVLELQPPAEPHASIVDASRLEGGDPRAFRSAERYLSHYGELLKAWVTRLALVRPRGLGGAIVAGAYEVLPRPYPVRVFGDAGSAFEWLAEGKTRGWPKDGAAVLAELYSGATGIPHVVGSLRALLDGHLAGLAVAEAAARLGMSERSLQRKLAEAETTFQDELADARVRAAKRMLLDGDAPLTAIAFDVGCASLQHFSALFRKRTRLSPSAFRQKSRKGP